MGPLLKSGTGAVLGDGILVDFGGTMLWNATGMTTGAGMKALAGIDWGPGSCGCWGVGGCAEGCACGI